MKFANLFFLQIESEPTIMCYESVKHRRVFVDFDGQRPEREEGGPGGTQQRGSQQAQPRQRPPQRSSTPSIQRNTKG